MDAKAAPGEHDLSKLLSTLTTVLCPETYVFATCHNVSLQILRDPAVKMIFHEKEGSTIITTQESAVEHGLDANFQCRMITLDVHSSLEAVGFLAVITNKLKELGMGVNPVSGFYHDHLYVPLGREHDAIRALEEVKSEAQEMVSSGT